MSEAIHMTPSHGEYKKEKYILWKEVLKNLIVDVDKLSAKEVSEKLNTYSETKPWDKNSNTFEMMALYQKSLQLLWSKEVKKVDALFGWDTFKWIKEIQEKNLGFKWRDIDGLPGPTTTKALIKELQKRDTPVQEKVVPAENTENAKISELIGNAKKKSDIVYLTWAGSFYNGSSPTSIEYAVVKQLDGEFYLYDKPVGWIRTIYRTDGKYTLISSATVKEWNITQLKWVPIKEAIYMPTPKLQIQQ